MKYGVSVLVLAAALAGCGGGDAPVEPAVIVVGSGASQQVFPGADSPDRTTWPPSQPVPGGAVFDVVLEVRGGKPPYDVVLALPAPIGLIRLNQPDPFTRSFTATTGQALYLSAASLDRSSHGLGGVTVTMYANGRPIATSTGLDNTATATITAVCC